MEFNVVCLFAFWSCVGTSESKSNQKWKIKLNVTLNTLNSVFDWGMKYKVWLAVVWKQNTNEIQGLACCCVEAKH
jgi:hypothetical protein